MKRIPLAALALGLGLLPALATAEPPTQFGVPALSRADFNRLAMLANRPFFWVEDKNENRRIEPNELVVLAQGSAKNPFVHPRRGLTPRFASSYRALAEMRRAEAIRAELNGGHPTLIHTDLRDAPPPEKQLMRHLLKAARIIEDLYLRQTGGFRHKKAILRASPTSKYLYWRNHGPWCVSPETANDPFCNALPTYPERVSEAYPIGIEQNDAMCKELAAQPNAKELLNPFTVVRRKGAGYVAKPYTEQFRGAMRVVAKELRAAARAVTRLPDEKAFHTYLMAAARGFETNNWEPADEAWAAMNGKNSRFYLRVGPDEVYFDPCQQKAGFHMSLALIDKSSLQWQEKLTPLRRQMEQEIAALIGAPYKARDVRFHMPDFINIVLNAGDSRHPLGATIGQSLPNWGKVAAEGRGRTVVMANLYTDPDSKRFAREKAATLLSQATMEHFTDDATPFLVNIILHEATHNFGPHSDYRVGGKTPKELFGGKLASTLEELKAQTGGLWYLQLLRRNGLISEAQLNQAYTRAITWAFGHISRGMFTPSGNVRPYSQLAAVQVGSFMRDGALSFEKGKFTIHFDKLPGSIEKLLVQVGKIKATGDRAGGQRLIDHFVKGKGKGRVHMPRIREALLRFPKASFRYSVVF